MIFLLHSYLVKFSDDVGWLVLNVGLLSEVKRINGSHLAQTPAPLVNRGSVLVWSVPTEGGSISAASAKLFTPCKNVLALQLHVY